MKRFCKICNAKYNYCPTCAQDRNKPYWFMNYDCENCRNIWVALTRYGSGEITKEQVTDLLLELDLSELDSFVPRIKERINSILNSYEKVEESGEAVENEKGFKKSRGAKKISDAIKD